MHKQALKSASLEQLLLLVLSLPLCILAAMSFFRLNIYTLLASCGFAFFLARSFEQYLSQRRVRRARRSLMDFLQFLSSSVAAGQTVRHVLQQMGDSSFVERSTDKHLKLGLKRVSRLIQAQQAQKSYLPVLEACFPRPEAEALLYGLRLENQLGEKLLDLLRDSFDTARELVMLEDEMAAAGNRQRSEGLILALLPFFMAPLFNDLISVPTLTSTTNGLSSMFRMAAYALAVSAFILHLNLSAGSSAKLRNENSSGFLFKLISAERVSSMTWLKRLGSKLPVSYTRRLERDYRLAFPQYFFNTDHETLSPFVLQHVLTLLLILLGSLVALLFISVLLGIAFYRVLVLPAAFAILFEVRLHSGAAQNEAGLRHDLPLMISLLGRLLKNGLSLPSALIECARVFSGRNSPLSVVISTMSGRISHAQSASVMFEQIAAGIKISDMASLLYLLARYTKLGSHELLDILDKQLNLCWAEQRQNIRRSLDSRSGLMLLPMLMDLLSVMLIGAAPAMQIFTAF